MSSIFSKIVAGEIPCYKIVENDHCLAFLDVSPVAKGHTLIIPKKEVDLLFDLEDDLYMEVHLMAKKVAKALKKTFPCIRISSAVVGLEVPHAHVHLIPLNSMSEFGFTNPRLSFSSQEMEEIAAEIASNL